MTDAFLGEIRIFAGSFAPRYWAVCDGQQLPIAQNTALYSVLGATYGGDGLSWFALPDLQGRVPMEAGHSPGLTNRPLGEAGGESFTTLTTENLPAHSHVLKGSSADVELPDPTGGLSGVAPSDNLYRANADATMHPDTLAASGGDQPHNNLQPYLPLTFIIALAGNYPRTAASGRTRHTAGAQA